MSGLPPFAALRAFDAVGREGGIRKAAAALGLDHAVVSRHVRSLEEWMGIALFHRREGRLQLTEAGTRFHGRIAQAIAEIAGATAEATGDGTAGGRGRSLKTWCVPGFAAQWLTDQITDFEAAFPDHRVELRPTDQAANLLAREADVDIRFYGDDYAPAPGGKGLRSVALARPAIFPVASPDMAERLAGAAATDLIDAPLLHEEHDEQWRAWLRLNGVPVPNRLPGPLLWHAHLAIAAARRGRGVALASDYLVGRDLKQGMLVKVAIAGTHPVELGTYAFVAREDRWASPAIAALRRFLQARTAGQAAPSD
ncbi:LysR substrate-binding domain-containing protein [Sphingosinicella rhizophila]|uniref:LysR substrate-binding domain-containing protein n=1 Tax=Sphingosinicella rhizophila TaxID=3050082 RepID=A0ABU3Q6X0_9SPHN|nr:LysR substrate-binding domain-containing protein [Sphingosinicella sp. GR2756]MDT9599150.1 LysR substrate-binding domain-containing protein [Sphingosinicella sp. GR2756]